MNINYVILHFIFKTISPKPKEILILLSGTLEERGITVWEKQIGEASKDDVTGKPDPKLATYDFPIGMSFIRKWSWTKYFPICPTFKLSNISCRKQKVNHGDKATSDNTNGTPETGNGPV